MIKGLLLILTLIGGMAQAAGASANTANYGFPPASAVLLPATPDEPKVLMHIQYKSGGGGTHTCADLRDCYVKHLNYEARGAEQYCRKIVITRDGQVVWWRTYE